MTRTTDKSRRIGERVNWDARTGDYIELDNSFLNKRVRAYVGDTTPNVVILKNAIGDFLADYTYDELAKRNAVYVDREPATTPEPASSADRV